jgi:phenylacetic acid degradation operon negative regulatory protein
MRPEIPSATTLVLDFLAAAADHKMSAQGLCHACSIMGYGEAATRVALTRLAQQGKILKLERATYLLDSRSNRLQRDVENWRERITWIVPWGGDWLAVHDGAINRREKSGLRRHRRALELRGFKEWRPGLQVRPNNLSGGAETLRRQLAELGLAAGAELFVATGFDQKQTPVLRRLWNLPALRRNYAKMRSRLEQSERRLKSAGPVAGARESLLVGRELIGQMLKDPLLPVEMVESEEYLQLAGLIADYQDFSRRIWDRVLAEA